ncbi:alcohol dehydrogenase catalytic domain-containing protein [Corallibacter sp.]|uniref:alcohol dehydrogenase catalytic domain-containing protein n=1 Tax=Corallibacter sp. TaxID=2038084 RepID=UPI003A8D79F8
MRALAVLSPALSKKIEAKEKYILEIDSLKIPLALIHVPDTEFDENNPQLDNAVLVKKVGFSLNYRDQGVIESAWYKLSKDNQEAYYPIGSEFCGKVVKVGKKVTNLNIGDHVIANCSYPYAPDNVAPGIPSNHASKELEIFHKGKLIKIPNAIPADQACGMSIGVQTAFSMIRKADIKPGQNVLVTSITSNTSLITLNFLKNIGCNVYGMSYSTKGINLVKEHFPFVKDIFEFKNLELPQNLFFDAVIDPFADTHLKKLQNHLNFGANYVTCGMYNQSKEKFNSEASLENLPGLLSGLISRNVSLIGNCLGTTEDLETGVNILAKDSDSNIVIDSVFNENDINTFIEKSFNKSSYKVGKVILLY